MVSIVTRLATDFDGRAVVGSVDVNTQAVLARNYGVAYVPTFVLFRNGREVSRQTGTTTYDDLAGKLQALVNAP